MLARGGIQPSSPLLTDRERIAHDLHDQVIQRVFAVGLDLQGVIARVRDPELTQRLSRSVDELQAVITEIRSTIFNLQHPVDSTGGLAAHIHNVFEQLTNNRDVAATLNLSGPLSIVSPDLAAHAEAVVTEALSNAVRHSGAEEISVSVAVGDDLTIVVTDNGCGIPADNRRSSGLRNLARRAESAGGVFTVSEGMPVAQSWCGKLRSPRNDRSSSYCAGQSISVYRRRRSGLFGWRDRGEHLGDVGFGAAPVEAEPVQCAAVLLGIGQREEHVFGADVVVAQAKCFAEGQFQGLAGTGVERDQCRYLGHLRR